MNRQFLAQLLPSLLPNLSPLKELSGNHPERSSSINFQHQGRTRQTITAEIYAAARICRCAADIVGSVPIFSLFLPIHQHVHSRDSYLTPTFADYLPIVYPSLKASTRSPWSARDCLLSTVSQTYRSTSMYPCIKLCRNCNNHTTPWRGPADR